MILLPLAIRLSRRVIASAQLTADHLGTADGRHLTSRPEAAIAAALGVILGLPVALYVNHRLNERQEELAKARAIAQRDEVIQVLINALWYNERLFDHTLRLTLQGRVNRYLDLRSTTWEAISRWFVPACSHPELLQALSHHWLRLRNLQALNDELFRRTVGADPPIADASIVPGMWWELRELTISLFAHSSQLAAALGELRQGQAVSALERDPLSFLPAEWAAVAYRVDAVQNSQADH